MQAMTQDDYGPLDQVLEIGEVKQPVARDGEVLVNGASGGVGTFAVQIAKALGAEVSGVCSARNAKLIKSLGADHAIDYATDDFTKGDARYDLIQDNVGNHSLADTLRALAPGGTLLSNGAPVGGWFGGLGHVVDGRARGSVVITMGPAAI